MNAAKSRRQVFERVGVQLQHTQYQISITVEEFRIKTIRRRAAEAVCCAGADRQAEGGVSG